MLLGSPAYVRFASLFLCSVGMVLAQSPQHNFPTPANGFSGLFSEAANRWQLTVGEGATSADPTSRANRAARNAFWSEQMQMYRSIPGVGSGVSVGGGSFRADAPEIDPAQGKCFVVARFETFRVFDTSKGDYLPYTEMAFRVRRVLTNRSGPLLSSGATIAIDIPGGSLRRPNGQIVTVGVSAHQHFFQPHHTYLLQLQPSIGQSYSYVKRWELTSGTVQPDTSQEILRSRQGTSTLQGHSIDDLPALVTSLLEGTNAK